MSSEAYKVFYSYLDDLLRLQSKAADVYEHTCVLGSVRENFLINIIKEKIDNINIHSGQIIALNKNKGQADILIRKKNTINTSIGDQIRIMALDCNALIEVKSNATTTDFNNFDKKAEEIKKENKDILCGLVCYKLSCKKKYILKKFGFIYDSTILAFENEKNESKNNYKNIDFVFCMDDDFENGIKEVDNSKYNKFFYVYKNEQCNSKKYSLVISPPFTFYFLSKIQSCII